MKIADTKIRKKYTEPSDLRKKLTEYTNNRLLSRHLVYSGFHFLLFFICHRDPGISLAKCWPVKQNPAYSLRFTGLCV